jgi:hypothetical protein
MNTHLTGSLISANKRSWLREFRNTTMTTIERNSFAYKCIFPKIAERIIPLSGIVGASTNIVKIGDLCPLGTSVR